MTEQKKSDVVSKKIIHKKCDITSEYIANALPAKMPQVTSEQHRARTKKRDDHYNTHPSTEKTSEDST